MKRSLSGKHWGKFIGLRSKRKCLSPRYARLNEEAYRDVVFRNGNEPHNYQVAVNLIEPNESDKAQGTPDIVWLSIKRVDKEPLHDWRHLQEIKNMLVGPEYEGMEMYPAESRVVDSANQYHLWVVNDESFRWPWGFKDGFKSEIMVGGSKQRKFK
jgi:hypothetical protein